MSHVAQISYTSATFSVPPSNCLALASNTQQCPATSFEFQPVTKGLGVVLGEQVAKRLPIVKKVMEFGYSFFSAVSSFWSKVPSLVIPGAVAVPACVPSVGNSCKPVTCLIPEGSYTNSCYKQVVTYSSVSEQCHLAARCETIDSMGETVLRNATLSYAPETVLYVENINGVLVSANSREEVANTRLSALSTTVTNPAALEKEQATVVGALEPGDVITVDNSDQPHVVLPKQWDPRDAFSAFQRIAHGTGGIMGHALSAEMLQPLMKQMSAHILKVAESHELVDVAFVLDTTSSMRPYIEKVRESLVEFLQSLQARKKKDATTSSMFPYIEKVWENFVAFLESLQARKKKDANTCRVAVVEYRDVEAEFVSRVTTSFTSDFDQLQTAVEKIEVKGGGDAPEAVLDGLLTASDELVWDPRAKRIVILIGDAAPKPMTQDGIFSEKAVMSIYLNKYIKIAVYPIFSA